MRLFDPVLDLLFPAACAACGAVEAVPGGLCGGCAANLPPPRRRCPRCGRATGAHGAVAPCPDCEGEDLGLDGVVAAWSYAGTARDLVLALKMSRRQEAARALGAALVDALLDAGVPGDLLVPVPLARGRRRERGFDQAVLIARVLRTHLGLDLATRALVRRRETQPQATQSRTRRRRGTRGAFRARRARVVGRCVLLVDDVLTTGATARAAALCLRRAGATSVVAAVACRAS